MPPVNLRGMRRKIAVVVRNEDANTPRKRTLYEISKMLGKRPGDIQRTVRQMLTEGLLRSDGPPGRGTHYWFNEEEFGEALEASLESGWSKGQLLVDQRILRISAPEDADLFSVLGRTDLNGTISWVAEMGGGREFLIGMAEGTPLRALEQLATALQRASVECVRLRVGELMGPADLQGTGIAIDEAQEAVTV
jgi:hypothetical protein